jgi:RNA polymerase sigma-70 factor (ECF subfamily)
MNRDDWNERLSRISTQWSALLEAHAGGPGARTAARALLLRYHGAVYRYLLGALRDPGAAEEQCHEFAVRFLRGDFRGASPERGRFRAYLKTALVHLVNDYHRDRQHWPRQLSPDAPEPAAPVEGEDESAFVASWRDELLVRTWRALEEDNSAQHKALRCRIDHPDLSSAELAERLTAELGKPVNAAWVRKTIQRARARWADLLLDEVACSLEAPELEQLRAELIALDLLRYCGSALARRETAVRSPRS